MLRRTHHMSTQRPLRGSTTVAPLPPQEASGLWMNEVPNSMWQSPVFCDPAWGATGEEQRRNATVHYWRTNTFIDHEIGRVLKQLKTLDPEDDTIIVFVSDHGWSMGLHDRYGKFSLIDHEAKAPMLISVPWETSSHARQPPTQTSVARARGLVARIVERPRRLPHRLGAINPLTRLLL